MGIPDPPVSMTGIQFVGVRPGQAPDAARALRHDAQGRLVLGRVELPQVEVPLLAQEDPADEHDLDYVNKLELLACHVQDTFLESVQLHR